MTKTEDNSPRKVSDYRGEKTWIYRGHRISTKSRKEGSYPRRVTSWTECTIDGARYSGVNGMRAAVKFIDTNMKKPKRIITLTNTTTGKVLCTVNHLDDLECEIDYRIDPWDEAETEIGFTEFDSHTGRYFESRETVTVEAYLEELAAERQRVIDEGNRLCYSN